MIFAWQTNAQRTISGTITDGKEAVIGASVVVKGTTTGTITDVDGKPPQLLQPLPFQPSDTKQKKWLFLNQGY